MVWECINGQSHRQSDTDVIVIVIIIMKNYRTPLMCSLVPYNTISIVVYKTNSTVLKTNRMFGLAETEEMCLEFLAEAGAK